MLTIGDRTWHVLWHRYNAGSRITDYISLGVLTKTFPLDKVRAMVAAAGKTNQLQRDLPAHVVVLLPHRVEPVHAGLVSRSAALLLEGIQWLLGPA